ncbi:YdbH domain-containing protein [Sphingomonas sp. SUN019]|uniref:YdbH domain-containing protein n=1 Tax=Sphingomonas sp. SUN019 TaxID=2937788 RepID=UPI0021641D9E|nr:YdbH domain-containing protein [Sphingomonas sp. SUN019]UVO51706.1 YdbH domain-containing protein [Sphingomonas sp. SUN019]
MAAADEQDAPRRRSTRFRVFVAVAVLVCVLLFGVWLARVPIASGLIDDRLAASGVRAQYEIADLGFGRQRLTNVVLGDPARPDLAADWVETVTRIGIGGPVVTGVRAGSVRMRGRLVDGKLSLGVIDRLLPAPSGAPFALPAIDLSVADGRMRLETPIGLVGVKLSGRGRLDDGFRGTLALASERLAASGCAVTGPTALLSIATRATGPRVSGPVRARAVDCSGGTARDVALSVEATLSPALDRWNGRAGVNVARVAGGGARLSALGGTIDFAGDARRTEGRMALTGGAFAAAGASGRAVALRGTWRVAGGRAIVAGRAEAQGVAASRATQRMLASSGDTTVGTPVGPLAASAGRAAAAAARNFDAAGEFAWGTGGLLTLRRLGLNAANGARATFGQGEGVIVGDPRGVRIDGVAIVAGGGLPGMRVSLSQPLAGGAISGEARVDRYATGGANLALTPVRFSATPGGATRIAATATLSGPLGDGRVDGLRLPVVAVWDGRSRLTVNTSCAPVAFERLAVAGLVLRPMSASLCPVDGALVRVDSRGVSGGARTGALRLAGTLGSSPIAIAAAGAEMRIGARGFTVDRLGVRLGSTERVTRLDLARLDGAIAGGGVAGGFTGGSGQIGAVPLLLTDAAGRWKLAGGDLGVTGAMTVSDAQTDLPRFKPLSARDVSLTLKNGAIDAGGTLYEPIKSVKVADVRIVHTLASGVGQAKLAVPGIAFNDNFQPDELTRLTFGVIADVQGSVRGAGDIAWSPDGVTSTGAFRTDGIDLAAAFGPATGIKGEIRFTDLLNLESAAGQVATVASINPGVAVNDGRIVYRTLAGNRVQVDGGRWPFAGGTLTLQPTLLDFSAAVARRMTFRVDGMEAAQFLQQFDFKNLDATGVFDGVLPMVFDDAGGRIENGTLVVRQGGGTLAYVGDLTEKDLGTWGNIAFQALKSLKYQNLNVVMNGPLAGEMITEVRFAGVNQGEGARSNFLVRRLQRLPFVFNIRIKAPFRGLLDSAASFYDPKRLIQRNLPQLLEEQEKRAAPPTMPPVIQPPASETMP